MIYGIALLLAAIVIYYFIFRAQQAKSKDDVSPKPKDNQPNRQDAIRKGQLLADKRYNYVFGQIASFENKLLNDIALSEEEIAKAVENPETRFHFYEMLEAYDKTALFPEVYLNELSSAESQMAYWLLHGHAFGQLPDEMELVKSVEHKGPTDTPQTYYLFKFKMNAPHPASEKGWMIGACGPFIENKSPYRRAIGTFSKGDPFVEDQIDELVAWVDKHVHQHILSLSK